MQIQIQAQIHNKGSRYHRIAEKRTEPVLAISWWCLRHSRFLFLLLLWIFFRFFFFLILFQFSFSLYIAHRIGCSAAPVKPSWKRVFHISMFIYMNISLSGEIPAIRSEKRVQLPRNIFFFFLPLIDISDNNKTARKKTTIFNHYVAASPESFHAQNSAQDLDLAFWLSPSIRNRIPIRIRKKQQQHRHQLQGPTFTTTTAYVTVGLIIIPQLILYALCTVLCVCLSFSVDFKYFHRFINIFALTASSDWNWNSFFLYIDTTNS